MLPKPARQLARNAGKQFSGLKSAKNVFAREEDYDMEEEVLYQDLTAPYGFATHGATRDGGGHHAVIRSFGKHTLAPSPSPLPSCASILAFMIDNFPAGGCCRPKDCDSSIEQAMSARRTAFRGILRRRPSFLTSLVTLKVLGTYC